MENSLIQIKKENNNINIDVNTDIEIKNVPCLDESSIVTNVPK